MSSIRGFIIISSKLFMVRTVSPLRMLAYRYSKQTVYYNRIAHPIRSEGPSSSVALTCEGSAPCGLPQGLCESCSPVAQQDCERHRRCEDALEDMGSVSSSLSTNRSTHRLTRPFLYYIQAYYLFFNGSLPSNALPHPPVVSSQSNAPKAGACSSTTPWNTSTTSSPTPSSPHLSLSLPSLFSLTPEPRRNITPPHQPSPPHRRPSPSIPIPTPTLLLPHCSTHQNHRH